MKIYVVIGQTENIELVTEEKDHILEKIDLIPFSEIQVWLYGNKEHTHTSTNFLFE